MNTITKLLSIGAGILIVGIIISFSIWFKAEHLDEGSYLTTETIKPDHAFRLQTTGEDLRVYEFTPKSAPHMQCVLVAGTNKGDNTCFPKVSFIQQQRKIIE